MQERMQQLQREIEMLKEALGQQEAQAQGGGKPYVQGTMEPSTPVQQEGRNYQRPPPAQGIANPVLGTIHAMGRHPPRATATFDQGTMGRPPLPTFIPGFATQPRGMVSFPPNDGILATSQGTTHNRNTMNPYGYNRPSAPAKFDGSADPVALNNWSKIMRHYLTMCGLSLDGLECVYMVGTLLTGGALSFYTERVIDHYDEYHNFAALYAGLREHFLRPGWGDDLIDQWTNVFQKNGESIRSLAQRLTSIMDVLPYPMDGQQLIHKLLYSMRPDIHERVMPLINPADRFEDIIVTAERFDLNMGAYRASHSNGQGRVSNTPQWNDNRAKPPNNSRTSSRNDKRGGSFIKKEPHQQGNGFNKPTTRAGNDKPSYAKPDSPFRLSVEQREVLKEANRCFKCYSIGHGSNDCKNERKKAVDMERIIKGGRTVSTVVSNDAAEVSPPSSAVTITAEVDETQPIEVSPPPASTTIETKQPQYTMPADVPAERPQKAWINQIRANVVADTASDLDLIDKDFLDRHNIESYQIGEDRSFRTPGSDRVVYNTFVNVHIHVANVKTVRIFYIVKGLPADAILGRPFLADFQAILSYNGGSTPQIRFQSKKWKTKSVSPSPSPEEPGQPPPKRFIEDGISTPDGHRKKVKLNQSVSSVEHTGQSTMEDRILADYSDVICDSIPSQLPPLRTVNHRIPIIDKDIKVKPRTYSCPDVLRAPLLDKIERYVKAGWWVRVGNSDDCVPLLSLYKKDRSLRTTMDCRLRNDNTRRDEYPIPAQRPILEAVNKATHVSTLDISDAYELMRVEPEDVKHTAFRTPFGNFVSNVMQQGDANAPATWARFMDTVFSDMEKDGVHNYFDDLVVATIGTEEQHEEILRRVLDRLRSNFLFIRPKKCHILSATTKILGRIISEHGIEMDPAKIDALLSFKRPQTRKELGAMLGLFQWIAPHIFNAASAVAPLHSLNKAGEAYVWKDTHQKAFEEMKKAARQAFPLSSIDSSPNAHPLHLVTDASLVSGAGYLIQGPSYKEGKIIGFYSHKHTPAEINYSTHEQETLAFVGALTEFHDRLLGRKFTAYTDSQSLSQFSKQPNLSRRQARWCELISRFNYTIVHIPGVENEMADALSRLPTTMSIRSESPPDNFDDEVPRLEPRMPDKDQHVAITTRASNKNHSYSHLRTTRNKENPIEPTVKLPPTAGIRDTATRDRPRESAAHRSLKEDRRPAFWIDPKPIRPTPRVQQAPAVPLAPLPPLADVHIRDAVIKGYSEEKFYTTIMANPERYPGFRVDKTGRIFQSDAESRKDGTFPPSHDRLCIPNAVIRGRSVREVLISHGHQTLGHYGRKKTLDYVRSSYFWPSLARDVDEYVRTCHVCATTKSRTTATTGFANPLPVPEAPWTDIALDFIGPLPPSLDDEGRLHDFILVIADRLSGGVIIIPTQITAGAPEAARLFYNFVYRHHGVPNSIVSDRDVRWTSAFWIAFHDLLGSDLRMSTAFHPQTDGQTERANKSIGQILRALIQGNQTSWAKHLVATEFAINSATSASSNFSPFELSGGRRPRPIPALTKTFSASPAASELVDDIRTSHLAAHDALLDARTKQSMYTNKHRRATPEYKVGEKVYVSSADFNFPPNLARKLIPKYMGPYAIVEAYPHDVYKLDLPPHFKHFRKFGGAKLREFRQNDDSRFPRRDYKEVAPDPQEERDGDYEIESILKHRWDSKKQRWFLIKFKNYPTSDAEWIPEADMSADDFVRAYEKLKPRSKQHPRP